MSHWNYYLDESGQSKSTTPHAVFGGFGVDARFEEDLLNELKALYKNCFGIPYEESFDLKGKKLFDWDTLKHLRADKPYSDEERQDLCAQLMSKNQSNLANAIKDKRKLLPAKAEANLKFIDEFIPILEKFDCKLFCSLAPYGIDVPLRDLTLIEKREQIYLTKSDDNYVTTLIKELEANVYEQIFDFTNFEKIENNVVTADETDRKNFDLRQSYFEGTHKIFLEQRKLKNLSKFSFNTRESSELLLLQIADILIYLINWAYTEPLIKQNNYPHIEKVYFYNLNKNVIIKESFFNIYRIFTGYNSVDHSNE